MARSLLSLAGVRPVPAALAESVLVIIDAQREYLDGALPLDGIGESLDEAGAVLEKARAAGTPVIHVVHVSPAGAPLFAAESLGSEIAPPLTPREGEAVVKKTLPDSFARTTLEEEIARSGRSRLIVMGYMTHMCVSTTVRSALNKGLPVTLVAGATATRDLPDPLTGGVVPAAEVQRASLAALADRFAVVVGGAGDIA